MSELIYQDGVSYRIADVLESFFEIKIVADGARGGFLLTASHNLGFGVSFHGISMYDVMRKTAEIELKRQAYLKEKEING